MSIISTTIDKDTPTVIYTSSGQSVVSVIYLCNIGAAQSFDLHLIPSGGSAQETNLVYSTVPITDSDTYVIDTEKLILGNGDKIAAKASSFNYVASTSGIIATVCYMGA